MPTDNPDDKASAAASEQQAKKQKKNQQDEYDLLQKIVELRTQSVEQKENELKASLELLKIEKASESVQRKFQQEMKIDIDALKLKELERLELIKEKSDQEKASLKLLQEEFQLTKYEGIELLAHIQSLEKKNKLLKDAVESEKKFGSSLAASFTSVTKIGGESTTLLGKLVQTAGAGGSIANALGDGLTKIKSMASAANISAALFDAIVNKAVQLGLEFDKAGASFEKQFGNFRFYKEQIETARLATSSYSVSIQEAADATGKLISGFANFKNQAEATRQEMINTVAALGAISEGSKEAVQNIDFLTKGLNMTATAATAFQKQLYGTAVAMGLPTDKLIKDFGSATPILAGYGKRMETVFMGLENASQKTGIEFNKLLGYTSKFRTFDEAASAAGQLNAILGGDYLNSIELLNATDEEKVRIMQESLRLSGRKLQDMSLEEQMATAQALGLSDVADLQRLMNNQTAEGRAQLVSQQKAQELMNKASQDAIELGKKWTEMTNRLFLTLKPVIDLIKGGIDIINKFIEKHQDLAKVLGVVTIAVAAFFAAWAFKGAIGIVKDVANISKSIGSLTTATTQATQGMANLGSTIASTGKDVTSTAPKLNQAAGGMNATGTAARSSWQSILAFGAAIMMVGAGIYLATAGIAKLAESFKGLNTEQIWGVVGVLGGLFVALALIGGFMASPWGAAIGAGLLGFGAALMLIGVGAALILVPISMIINGFAKLATASKDLKKGQMSEPIEELFTTLISFKAAFGISAMEDITIAGNALSKSMSSLRNALSGISKYSNIFSSIFPPDTVEKMTKIAVQFEKIGQSFSSSFSGAFAESMKKIAETINEMSLIKVSALATIAVATIVTAPVTAMANSIAQIPEAMTNTATPTANRTNTSTSASTTNQTAVVPTATPTANRTNTSTSASTTNQTAVVPVQILLDGKEVGKIVGEYLTKDDVYMNKFRDKIFAPTKKA